MVKLFCVAVAINEVLTWAFTLVATRVASDVSASLISMFSLVTSALVGFWLQNDAKRAYAAAKAGGFIVAAKTPEQTPLVRDGCPRRWLVVMHIELNPAALAGKIAGK